MPIYEYRCSACEAEYELRQGFDDAPNHACQRCGDGEARRVLRPPAIVFKGSGFYATDSRNGSGGRRSHSDSEKRADDSQAAPAVASADRAGGSGGEGGSAGGDDD